jgi:hypothetical protein
MHTQLIILAARDEDHRCFDGTTRFLQVLILEYLRIERIILAIGPQCYLGWHETVFDLIGASVRAAALNRTPIVGQLDDTAAVATVRKYQDANPCGKLPEQGVQFIIDEFTID